MVRNVVLEYSAHKLKKSCEPYCKKKRFYKLMYLLNKELKTKGVDIKLPYYWYIYGVVVDDGAYYFNLRDLSDFSEISQKMRSLIDNAIFTIKKKYRYLKRNEINSKIYQKAPYEFQDEFRKILEIVDSWRNNEIDDFSFSSADLIDHKLILKFPENDFSELYSLFLEWDNILSYILKNQLSEKNEIIKLIDKFWDVFSKKLRILKNENIKPPTIERWKKGYEDSLSSFEKFMFKESSKFYTEYYKLSNKHREIVENLHKLASRTIWE